MLQAEKSDLPWLTKSNQQGRDVLAAQHILQLKGLCVGLINETKLDRSEEKTIIRKEVDLIKEKYVGIRPAPGYPACPDHFSDALVLSGVHVCC